LDSHLQQPILLTGGAGFLGLHLKKALGSVTHLSPRSSELNLLDFEATKRYLSQYEIRTIIHAAGFVGGIGLNKAHPGRMISENLRMGMNVLQAAAEKGGMHVCIISTVCVYPQEAPIPTPEFSLYDGYPAQDTGFYGIAKRTLRTLAEGLRREYGLTYSYVIPTNLYGPGDHFEAEKSHVVPALIKRALEAKESGAKELIAWGNGSQTRDLLYVEDAATGVLLSLNPAGHNQVINLSSGHEITIKELAETVCEVVDFGGNIVWDATKPGGAPRRALDSEKASNLLGFCSRMPLREGLEKTYQWYLAKRRRI
jgi:GDP-L-fucose synthase